MSLEVAQRLERLDLRSREVRSRLRTGAFFFHREQGPAQLGLPMVLLLRETDCLARISAQIEELGGAVLLPGASRRSPAEPGSLHDP